MVELDKIYNESCIKTLSRLEDKSVKLTITSVPYNMGLRIRGGKYIKKSPSDLSSTTKYKEFSDDLSIEEFYTFHKQVLDELLRVSETVFYNFQIVTGSKEAFFSNKF